MQLQPSSALSRWALTRTLIRRPTQVLLEASICPIWSTRISSTTWTLTWPISNCTWFHAVGNEVAGATCRRILKTTVSSETRTEWTILVWLLTRGVSLLKTSTSPSTRAETCRPLEAQIEVARPHTALLSLKTRDLLLRRRHPGNSSITNKLQHRVQETSSGQASSTSATTSGRPRTILEIGPTCCSGLEKAVEVSRPKITRPLVQDGLSNTWNGV